MEIRIDDIDPLYDRGMGWIRANVTFSWDLAPDDPADPEAAVRVLVVIPGDPAETFAAFQTRALAAAYGLLEHVLAHRADAAPPSLPPE